MAPSGASSPGSSTRAPRSSGDGTCRGRKAPRCLACSPSSSSRSTATIAVGAHVSPLFSSPAGIVSHARASLFPHFAAPKHARPGSRISSLEMFDATQLRCAFLEPPSIDARLVHQQGLFSVLSPETDMEALLMSHPSCARKIIVPAWLKREVRDKLDAIGVSERTLFPGLDGLCTWLRRYYTKVRACALDACFCEVGCFCAAAGASCGCVLLRCAAFAPSLVASAGRATGGSTRPGRLPRGRGSARGARTRRPRGPRRIRLQKRRHAEHGVWRRRACARCGRGTRTTATKRRLLASMARRTSPSWASRWPHPCQATGAAGATARTPPWRLCTSSGRMHAALRWLGETGYEAACGLVT